ncbi:MAG: hypothetical protein RIC56_23865 [Pseudomonadales bacterium]
MARLFTLIAIVLLATGAHATTKAFRTSATRVLSDTSNFGGCMVHLTKTPLEEGLDCNGPWVSFSCSGDFAPRDAAVRNFEIAQIAVLTELTILVVVDDTKKHNGYCFASRIDLLRQ